jgi:hypothetical protein
LAKRRLNLLANNVPLKKLSNAIFFMGYLVKLSASGIWFIDSMGNLFTHAKLNSSKLIFRKIVQKLPISTGGFIIEVEGIPTRFKCLHGPKPDEFYAGILEYKHTYVLYGFYKEEHKTTRRMV